VLVIFCLKAQTTESAEFVLDLEGSSGTEGWTICRGVDWRNLPKHSFSVRSSCAPGRTCPRPSLENPVRAVPKLMALASDQGSDSVPLILRGRVSDSYHGRSASVRYNRGGCTEEGSFRKWGMASAQHNGALPLRRRPLWTMLRFGNECGLISTVSPLPG
jgi:hypothetical protein